MDGNFDANLCTSDASEAQSTCASPEAILGKPNHNLAVKWTLRILGKALSQKYMTLSSSSSSSFPSNGKSQCILCKEQKILPLLILSFKLNFT